MRKTRKNIACEMLLGKSPMVDFMIRSNGAEAKRLI